MVFGWVGVEFGHWGRGGVKVGSESSEENMNEFWIGLDGFGLVADRLHAGDLPATARDGLALK